MGCTTQKLELPNTGLFSVEPEVTTSTLLKHSDDYINTYKSGGANGTVGKWIARCGGGLGNSLKVSVCASSNTYFNDNVSLVNDSSDYVMGALQSQLMQVHHS